MDAGVMRRIAMVMLLAAGCGGSSGGRPMVMVDAAVAPQDSTPPPPLDAAQVDVAPAVDAARDAMADAAPPLPDGSEQVISTPPSLLGTWTLVTTSGCGIGYTFRADKTYGWDVLCVLPDSTFGLEAESGTFRTSADRIEFTPAKASCPGTTASPYVQDYVSTATSLALSDTQTVLLFTPATSSGTGIAATYGCYANGAFTPGPYVAVP